MNFSWSDLNEQIFSPKTQINGLKAQELSLAAAGKSDGETM